ncbi:MAG: ParA family protein [Myxococcota bacterium]|nr:ParA family protein [Myxococcota bacterium]
MSAPLQSPRAVLTVASNKGGVGKTTVATNLAVYLRALYEDLPVLVVGLDDQSVIDRMFRLGGAPRHSERNLKHGWAERSFEHVIQLGQYGVHYVPTPPDTAALKTRAEDPLLLRTILERTGFEGLVILDTKSDLEALTLSAFAAADLAILPVSDLTSLEEAEKSFEWLRRLHGGQSIGRVLFTLVDRRTRVDASGRDLHERLVDAVEERGWPHFTTTISRSPRVESMISAGGAPGSILHHARGTGVHTQMRELAEEVAKLLDLGPSSVGESGSLRGADPVAEAPAVPSLGGALKSVLLRGLGTRS